MPALRAITAPCTYDEAIENPSGFGPFLPISLEEADSFNNVFYDELDSAFSSSIGCCEYCYADFRDHWPDIPFRRDGSEMMGMGTEWAVDESRLSGVWSPAEYSTLRRLIQCPRCLARDPANIYLFEHRFSEADAMERNIEELIDLGSNTPFLILEHPFAQRVLREIREVGAVASFQDLNEPLFRARLAADVTELNQRPDELNTYGPAPPAFVGEGRFNHAGAPMLYLANFQEVAASELGVAGAECFVGALALLRPLKVLDLYIPEGEDPASELLEALANSALLAAPRTGDGWLKRQYVFSRFVADCARSAGFDAIRYGSTKSRAGVNYVYLQPPGELTSFLRFIGYSTVISSVPDTRY